MSVNPCMIAPGEVNLINSYLPCEILTGIFATLPLDDRKNVRRTCKLWYACSTALSITKEEKFVFRTGFSVQDIAKVLLNPNYLQLNIEFQGLHIDSLPTYTWKSCGRRVHSLEFYHCRWSDKTIKNIILHCVDLTSFKVWTSFNLVERKLGSIFCSPRLLSDLIGKGVKRYRLHTFTLFVDDVHLPSSVLNKMLCICPNIKRFHTGTYSCEDPLFYCLVLHLGNEPVLSRLDKCLIKSSMLDSITFNIPTDGRWLKKFAESECDHQNRLYELETMLIHTPSMQTTLLDFFKVQRYLRVVRLSIGESNSAFAKELTFHVLENCFQLREFRLRFEPYSLTLSLAELPRFFTSISKLTCLSLSFDVSETHQYEKLPPLALTTLRIENPDMEEQFCATFLKSCPQLKHLEITHVSDEILQTIFKNLLNLETLILNFVDSYTNYGFIGEDATRNGGYSIRRLKNLKHLELNGYSGVALTEKFVHELQFPRLETLSIGIGLYKGLSEETVIDLAMNLPALKCVTIDEIEQAACVKKTVEFCRRLKGLKRLFCYESNVDEFYSTDIELLESIFEACPSLRYISDSEIYMILFNPFTKKIMYKTLDNFKFRGNVFEGDNPLTRDAHLGLYE